MSFIERHFLEPQRRMKQSHFEELTLLDGQVVFLGDSITEGGAWNEWFPQAPVINRGIGGDTTDGVLKRLDTAIHHPSQVFLLIGTNDLALRRPVDEIRANQRAIVEGIVTRAPETDLTIQSVMPRKPKFHARIERLNNTYRALAQEFGATYLDLWPALSDGAGALNPTFTLDGLHLNGAGYRAWTGLLRPYVHATRLKHPEREQNTSTLLESP